MFIKLLVLLSIFLLIFGTACSTNNQSDNEVFINDKEVYASNSDEVVLSDDSDFQIDSPSSNSKNPAQTRTVRAEDNSEITVMIDTLGNKSEMRVFSNHPRLASILMRTSADGHKQTFAYDQNGKVKPLPENMIEKAMTASADELANSAGIYTAKTESPSFTQNTKPLQPLPSSQFPIRNQQIQQTPPETEEPSDSNEKPQSVENKNNNEPTASADTQNSLNKKSDEKQ